MHQYLVIYIWFCVCTWFSCCNPHNLKYWEWIWIKTHLLKENLILILLFLYCIRKYSSQLEGGVLVMMPRHQTLYLPYCSTCGNGNLLTIMLFNKDMCDLLIVLQQPNVCGHCALLWGNCNLSQANFKTN